MAQRTIYGSIIFSVFIIHNALSMQHEASHYALKIQKHVQDAFRVKINAANNTLGKQKCSFVANFAQRTITDQQNMFPPFQLGKTNFTDRTESNFFLWNIPDFGLLKIGHDSSVYFGHESDTAPLAPHTLQFATPNTLFLQCLKVASLTTQSPQTQFCGTVVADKIVADHILTNSGGLKTNCLTGAGKLLNTGMLELAGTSTNPAIVSIKELISKTKSNTLTATIKGSHVQFTKENHYFYSGKKTEINIAHMTFEPSLSSFVTKGSLKTDFINLYRTALNHGFWQAARMSAQIFTNKLFGQVKILGETTINSGALLNEGEWQQQGKLTASTSTIENKGNFDCEQDISICPKSKFSNAGTLMLRKLTQLFVFLAKIESPGKVTAWYNAINFLKPANCADAKDYDFGNIGHLELLVNGAFTSHYVLKAPALSLNVAGLLTLGKSNDELGTLAGTHGSLTAIAHGVDGRYGKFYGKEESLIESTQGDITIGAPTRGVDEAIRQQYIANDPRSASLIRLNQKMLARYPNHPEKQINLGFDCTVNQKNSAYAACNNILTLRSAANIFIKYGSVWSALKNHLIAPKEVQNFSGKISSQGTTTIEADTYNHLREGVVEKPRGHGDHAQYPGSGPAILESLDIIDFCIKNKIHNLAGSMRSGKDILVNKSPLRGSPQYTEETQNFYTHGNYNVNGNPNAWAHQYYLKLTQSCTTQAADKIDMNLGDFIITGNISAGTFAVKGKSGLFANTSLSRNTLNPTQPTILNVTQYAQEQAQQSGFYRLCADNSVQTEFPLGAPSRPAIGNSVLLEDGQAAPLNWRNIFNPLSSINLDLFLQQMLGNLAGKVYAGKAKGNQLSSVLWANAGKWRQHNNKAIMSPEDMQRVQQSMLLSQILNIGANEEQHTLLCIAPHDINPYQSPGDIVADTVSCITENDQTHLNNRIVATGPQGITLQSTAGAINLETQKYAVTTESKDCKIVEEIAMPQQQLIAPAGPVTVKADGNITRTGTLIAAATNVTEQSEHASVIKNPLILQKTVETHHEKKGFFSSSCSTHTSLTHSALASETIAGAQLHDKANVAIKAVASRDVAGQEIIYDAPQTHIEGLLLANRNTSTTEKSGAFTASKTHSSKETPFAVQAQIQAPLVRFVGTDAQVNATIHARELRDETEHGIQFVAKVAQMLCSEQKLISSPLLSADVGYEAGYETMIPPMLLVEKIVRLRNDGCMHFESAIIDKDRTQIIGNFVETTYHLKQWQRSWNHVSQVISDEALVVIAFAITLATQGAGAEFMAPLLQNITAVTGMQLSATGIAAFNAGFSAVCAGMATSGLKTGDPIGAVKNIASPASLKSLAVTMASAGLCSQLGGMLDIDMTPGIKSLSAHVQEHALRNTVDTLLNVAINNASVDKALGSALKDIPLKAIAAYAANKICTTCTDIISRKTAHTALGGLSGYAMEHNRDGIISGMTGALTAETIGDMLVADAQEICAAARARVLNAQRPLSMQEAIDSEVRLRTNIAKITAVSIAALTKQNPSIASATASNALDNDLAIRSKLYALAEFQAMVTAASQAFVTFNTHEEIFETQYRELQESAQADKDIIEALNNPDGRKPFVKDPNSGVWFTACISDDLILTKGFGKVRYVLQRMLWHKHPKCPFTILAHGGATSVTLENKNIHPEGLADHNMEELQANGQVDLNYYELAQLIRTAPNYNEGQHIHLFSCECGAQQKGIAQWLADEMDVPVSAFTGLAAMNAVAFASVEMSGNCIPNLKEIKTFYPRSKDMEHWIENRLDNQP